MFSQFEFDINERGDKKKIKIIKTLTYIYICIAPTAFTAYLKYRSSGQETIKILQ